MRNLYSYEKDSKWYEFIIAIRLIEILPRITSWNIIGRVKINLKNHKVI